jgi:hypothetical protein
MSKEQNRGNREAKKPKATKKPKDAPGSGLQLPSRLPPSKPASK